MNNNWSWVKDAVQKKPIVPGTSHFVISETKSYLRHTKEGLAAIHSLEEQIAPWLNQAVDQLNSGSSYQDFRALIRASKPLLDSLNEQFPDQSGIDSQGYNTTSIRTNCESCEHAATPQLLLPYIEPIAESVPSVPSNSRQMDHGKHREKHDLSFPSFPSLSDPRLDRLRCIGEIEQSGAFEQNEEVKQQEQVIQHEENVQQEQLVQQQLAQQQLAHHKEVLQHEKNTSRYKYVKQKPRETSRKDDVTIKMESLSKDGHLRSDDNQTSSPGNLNLSILGKARANGDRARGSPKPALSFSHQSTPVSVQMVKQEPKDHKIPYRNSSSHTHKPSTRGHWESSERVQPAQRVERPQRVERASPGQSENSMEKIDPVGRVKSSDRSNQREKMYPMERVDPPHVHLGERVDQREGLSFRKTLDLPEGTDPVNPADKSTSSDTYHSFDHNPQPNHPNTNNVQKNTVMENSSDRENPSDDSFQAISTAIRKSFAGKTSMASDQGPLLANPVADSHTGRPTKSATSKDTSEKSLHPQYSLGKKTESTRESAWGPRIKSELDYSKVMSSSSPDPTMFGSRSFKHSAFMAPSFVPLPDRDLSTSLITTTKTQSTWPVRDNHTDTTIRMPNLESVLGEKVPVHSEPIHSEPIHSVPVKPVIESAGSNTTRFSPPTLRIRDLFTANNTNVTRFASAKSTQSSHSLQKDNDRILLSERASNRTTTEGSPLRRIAVPKLTPIARSPPENGSDRTPTRLPYISSDHSSRMQNKASRLIFEDSLRRSPAEHPAQQMDGAEGAERAEGAEGAEGAERAERAERADAAKALKRSVSPTRGSINIHRGSASPIRRSRSPILKSVIPLRRSGSPSLRPVKTVRKSASPVRKSASPVLKPVSPVLKPVSHVLKPVSHVLKSGKPLVKSASPVRKAPASSLRSAKKALRNEEIFKNRFSATALLPADGKSPEGPKVPRSSTNEGFTSRQHLKSKVSEHRIRAGRSPPGKPTPGRTTPGRTTTGRITPGRTTTGRITPGRITPGRTTPGRTTVRATARTTIRAMPKVALDLSTKQHLRLSYDAKAAIKVKGVSPVKKMPKQPEASRPASTSGQRHSSNSSEQTIPRKRAMGNAIPLPEAARGKLRRDVTSRLPGPLVSTAPLHHPKREGSKADVRGEVVKEGSPSSNLPDIPSDDESLRQTKYLESWAETPKAIKSMNDMNYVDPSMIYGDCPELDKRDVFQA